MSQPEPAAEHEYHFHVILAATVYMRSTSPQEALAALYQRLEDEPGTVIIAHEPDGSGIEAHVAMVDGQTAQCLEIDGNPCQIEVELPP